MGHEFEYRSTVVQDTNKMRECLCLSNHHQFLSPPVWPVKNRLMSIKVAQKLSHRKMNDFHIFTKMPNNVSNLGKIVVATGFECLPKKQKNRPIWSYWSPPSYIGTWYCFEFLWIGRKVFFVVLCYSLLRKSILCEQSKKYQSLVGLETIVEALIYW